MTPEEVQKLIKIINGEKVFEDSLYLSWHNLSSLESYNLSDVIVTGNFSCSHNNLTSLKGSPKQVKGGFWCCGNALTSLEGLPEKIGGKIYIKKEVVQKLYFTNPLVSLYAMQDKFRFI